MDSMMRSTKSELKLAHSWRFDALGTTWEVSSKDAISNDAKIRVTQELALFELTYSRFIGDSMVSVIARRPGAYTLPESADEIFTFYEELYELTEGKVTPLVGDTLVSAGYDAKYSLKPGGVIHDIPAYDEVVHHEGNVVTTNQPVILDIGAVGKGYAVDRVVELLRGHSYDSFVVDASGDMRIVGEATEKVGLEDPRNPSVVLGAVELKDRALCASAINRRAWGDWHHVIDPATKSPTKEIVATWVIADNAMRADGLATALFFVHPKTLRAKYTYEYMRMHANGSIEYSDYFAGGLFE